MVLEQRDDAVIGQKHVSRDETSIALTTDGKITKKIIREGHGALPSRHATCIGKKIHVALLCCLMKPDDYQDYPV